MPYSNIDKPNKYFDTKLYTGTGATQSITGLNFSPDLVWIKQRSAIRSHVLYDVIRGATKDLRSNDTTAEATDSATLSSFNSDGFTVVTDDKVNVSSGTYVSWCWDANGAGVSNTAGSITSTVSANTTSGFSIVSYTSNGTSGATVGHGLGVAPSMIIVKRRSSAEDWGVGHKSLGWTKFIRLNTTGAEATSTGLWNDTAPSSTVVTLGNSGISNVGSGTTMIMYCFAEVKGFSKAFSYTGNGSTDGSFIYCGFKPAWVMVKASSTTGQWAICDNRRGTANTANGEFLFAESSEALNAAVNNWDFLSNGLKARANYAAHNTSGVTYIGMAFAENPFVSSKGIPTTAR